MIKIRTQVMIARQSPMDGSERLFFGGDNKGLTTTLMKEEAKF